ncbi:MAG TPA: type II secretion system protein [Patescibacteria group bacterium]|nr:type II secretion system protein [Patescibacteria group bacterium]
MMKEQKKQLAGFTIVEMLVAMTVFVSTFVVILDVFSTTMRVNRRAEALVTASQGMRNFIEALVKEIRNSSIDYNYATTFNGNYTMTGSGAPCGVTSGSSGGTGVDIYRPAGGYMLGLSKHRDDGIYELNCYYFSDKNYNMPASQAAVNTANASSSTDDDYKYLALYKVINGNTGSAIRELLNKSSDNFTVEYLKFYVGPTSSPYLSRSTGTTKVPGIESFVTIVATFKVKLPGMNEADAITIPYQTTVSGDVYDLPAISSF